MRARLGQKKRVMRVKNSKKGYGQYVITLDQDMCIEHGSRGLWALLGYEKKDACNQNPDLYMEHIYSEDVNKYRMYLKDNRSVLDMSACEYRLVTKEGTVIDVLDTMEVVEDAKGLKHGYATVRDITDRPHAKRDIERAKNAEKMQEEEMREIMIMFYNLIGIWVTQVHVLICQNSASVHLRFVHFIICKLYIKRKTTKL